MLLYSFVSLKILIAGSFIIIIFCMLFIFSIVRYRLLDVNVFISRYVVYRSASILAVGIYLLLAGGLLKLTAIVGGEDFQYIKPIIIFCAVLLFLLFFFSERIRRKAQVFINKNFFANKYDYRLVWTRFTEELGEAVTIDKLMPALAEMIAGIMWVQPVSVWLYDEEEKSFNIAGRFNLSYIPYERISKFDFNEEIFFEKEIVDLKKINNNELGIFSEKFREIIKSSDTQLVLPLKIKEDLLGFLLIGGTVTGDELNDEDYELLQTLSRQSAGIIQSVRLAEKLRVTQQMESISKITTFVVHDLKNLISSLEVLLDNAKEYIDNKEFQKDMLETLENTGKKMTQMIEKISTASNDSLFVFNTFNLIDIIKISIDELKLDKNPRVKLFKEYDENKVVPVWGDEKAIKKVVSNVLINALQAIPKKDGEIKISIEMNKFAVILKIKDNGAGMSEEFINNYLFKPFKTTKEGGLGIGLYQCRTIINAHRDAELYCESAVGKGTTFFIKLPVSDRGDTN
ncbi:MAG: PEP-CTERM system histidine kinase PrsK [Candidatus Schekmanbacteria bacterium]|nr:MAG: PEP-CTERM system histidine kinase PrsK [Candidatus Schekmanbacteria bacterium]